MEREVLGFYGHSLHTTLNQQEAAACCLPQQRMSNEATFNTSGAPQSRGLNSPSLKSMHPPSLTATVHSPHGV